MPISFIFSVKRYLDRPPPPPPTFTTLLQVHLSCKSNSFSYERFCSKTRFETEAQGNSKMTYLLYFLFFFYYYLFFLFLTSLGLECYACTNIPELIGGTKCESDKAEKITCDPLLYNKCMTAKYTMSLGLLGSRSVEQRNCSNSFSCDPNSQFNSKCKSIYYLVESAW